MGTTRMTLLAALRNLSWSWNVKVSLEGGMFTQPEKE